MFTTFYNGSIRKMVVAFGSLFNKIDIDRTESTGTKHIRVPISYSSKEKYGNNFPWKKDNSYHKIQIAPGLVIV